MHSAQKPTLVIVHGGWHDPSCFDFVRKPLEDDGYTCHVPALPSVGELSAFKTSSDDVNIVHSIVKDCLAHGENVIVVGHSNGGLKANGALKGLVGQESSTCQDQGRVLGLGIIAGLIPPVRPTAPKNAPAGSEEPPQHLDQNRWKPSDTNSTILPRDPKHLFYNDMAPDQATHWASRIRPMHTQEMPSGYYEAWRHVPVSYLVCTKDNGIAEALQDAIIDRARAEGGVVYSTRVESGHSPFLSQPDKVVKWIKLMVEEELV